MGTRNTGTTFTDKDGNNSTKTHLSTNIIIKCKGNAIGALQKISFSESRKIVQIDECGTDGHIDSAPSASTDISGSAERIRFAGSRILMAFSLPYIHLHSQRIPFDIEVQDVFSSSDPSNSIITTFKNVWITKCNYSYESGNFIISESIDFDCESVSSILNNKNVAGSVAEGRANPIILNSFERQADRGVYRGALDASNLQNAFLQDPRD